MEIVQIKELADKIRDNVSKVIVGKDEIINLMLTSVLAGGHILLEDNPGTGKTMLAKSMAKSIEGDFKRVQFTPDLMPSDVTGLNVYSQKTGEFSLVKGPVFTNILLADEINRGTPRTQSSLLEAMEERQVTIDGETYKLLAPFMVIATQNPIETTGTYPLPEAQLDRFTMKLSMGQSKKDHELDIIGRFIDDNPLESISAVCKTADIVEASKGVKNVFVHECIREYIVNIILETRENGKSANGYGSGVSTRGTLSLVRCAQAYAAICGSQFVEPDHVKAVAPWVLGHRIPSVGGKHLKKGKELISEILSRVEVPVENWEK
ncbi:MAG: MoxR family ATPase [Lachnospiraceae bacterium]|nr:MoxR family ATPase [Lachnospiraceae bacterium]